MTSMNEIYAHRIKEGRAYVAHGLIPDELADAKGLVDRLTTTLESASMEAKAKEKIDMKLSEFVKLHKETVATLDTTFGRDMSSEEIVEWLFEYDLLDIAALEKFLKEEG